MSSLDPDEIKRVKVHVVKCPKCKLTVKVKPSEKKCPKCKYTLNRPSPEVIEKLRTLYREREHYNRALDRVLAQIEREYYLPPSERVPAERERERNARSLVEVSAQINKLLSKQEYYKKWFDGDGKVPLPDWIYEVTSGRPGQVRLSGRTKTWKRMNTLLFKDHAELRLRFFILSISCSKLKASRVCIKGCNIFLHSQAPPSLPKVFLLDLLGSHLAKSGLTTRAEKLLTICYADFFLYSIGNGAIRSIFLAKAVVYGNRLKIFYVIIFMMLSEKK